MVTRTRGAESAGSCLRAYDNTHLINQSGPNGHAQGKQPGCRVRSRFIGPLIVQRYVRSIKGERPVISNIVIAHAVIIVAVAGLIFLMREPPQQSRDDDSQEQ